MMLDMLSLFIKGVFIVEGSGTRGILRELFIRLNDELSQEYTQEQLDYGIVKEFSYKNFVYYHKLIPLKEIKGVINTTLGESYIDVEFELDSVYENILKNINNTDMIDFSFLFLRVKHIRIHFGDFLKMIFPHSNINKIKLIKATYIKDKINLETVYSCRMTNEKESKKIQKVRYGQKPTYHYICGSIDHAGNVKEITEPLYLEYIDGEFVHRYLRNLSSLETLYFDILKQKQKEAERIEKEKNERIRQEKIRAEEEQKRRDAETESERRARIYSQSPKDKTKIDHYQLLGVSFTASVQEIRESYLKIVKKIHPDVTHDDFYHQLTVSINHAYETLIDKERRLAYDIELINQITRKEKNV